MTDKVPTDVVMALLGEWARHCEHVLSRGALMAAADERTTIH